MSPAIAATLDVTELLTVPVPACPVCGVANDASPTIDRYGFRVSVSRCRCGLLYLNPRMTAAAAESFYRDTYRALAYEQYGGQAVEPTASMRDRGRCAGELLKRAGCLGGSLLDLGGGTGAFAQGVHESLPFSSITILDPNDDELARATEQGYDIVRGLVETQARSCLTYTVIVCAQTADHWLDPVAALGWMRAAITPSGFLYIDIIDARRWRRKHPAQAFKLDHPLYWTPDSFRQALQRTGWTVVAKWQNFNRVRHLYICEGA